MATPQPMNGTVVRIFREKQFGFLKGTNGQEYFFHRSSIADFDQVVEGDAVRFLPSEGPKGPRADSVERV